MDREFLFTFYYLLLLVATATYCLKLRPINRRRKELGMFNNLLQSMMAYDQDSFFKYTRMSLQSFHQLLVLVKPHLQRDPSRNPIVPEHRLILTLHYLAEGCSMQELAWGHMIGHSTACVIIKETADVLWKVLQPKYLKPPSTADWKSISTAYYKRWNFSNCLGSVDGKHVNIQAPKHAGSSFFNYKKFHSIVLMAICDAFYGFTLVDIGAAGSNHGATVFSASGFGRAILDDTLSFPEDKKMPKTNIAMPYFFAADATFPLSNRLMRPYAGTGLSDEKLIFNYRLSRGRRTIENAFDILVQRWRIFRKPIIAELSACEHITKATIVLHNFLQKAEEDMPESERRYIPTGYGDSILQDGTVRLGGWREEIEPLRRVGRLGANNFRRSAANQREQLCRFFNSPEGSVLWQWDLILRGLLPPNQ